MITMGCDIGSLYTKAVILDEDRLVASKIVPTTGNIADQILPFLDSVLAEAKLDKTQIEALVGTGSGADLIPGTVFCEDEVNCVGAATSYYIPELSLAIGIGGQHITSMLLDEDGIVTNLMRNDKCASGSGRFLEVMSAKLELSIDDFDAIVKTSRSPVEISNQCGVFAESEVITHVNAGENTADILAGVCMSVANIVVAQGRKFARANRYTLAGGVARIESVNQIIQSKLNGDYHPFPFDPMLAAAIGAALLGDSE